MRQTLSAKGILWMVALAGASLAHARPVFSQVPEQPASKRMDLETVGVLLQQLQSQMQKLQSQVDDLRAQQQSARAESAELRRQLETATAQLMKLEIPKNQISPSPPVVDATGPQ